MLYSIRVTSYYATNETENWNKALLDIAHAIEYRGIITPKYTDAIKAVNVIENIKKVIEMRRHENLKGPYME
jgi:hypothetical protein